MGNGTIGHGEESRENSEKNCPSYGESSVVRDYRKSIETCENCGRILREGIKDRGPEWRAFDQRQREEKSRGSPPSTETIHDKGLSTWIDYRNRDAKGNMLSPEKRREVYRLRKWHKRTRVKNATERNLTFALSETNRMCSQLGLSRCVQETASKIYRQVVLSATLYTTCREAMFYLCSSYEENFFFEVLKLSGS